MKVALNSYFSCVTTNPQNMHTMHDLITFTKSYSEEEYPARNVEGFERAAATSTDDPLYREMLAKDAYFSDKGGTPGALIDDKCHVLLIPTLSSTLQTLAAKAGSPILSVPMGSYPPDTKIGIDEKNGLVDVAPGIPFSVYVLGRAGRDEEVLRVGYVVEKALQVRKKLRPYLETETEVG